MGAMPAFIKRCTLLSLFFMTALATAAPLKPTFTQAEADWIRAHPVVRFASGTQVPPLEYEEDGRFKGLAADYLDFLSKQSGLRFEYVRTADWNAAQAALTSGEVDMLSNASVGRLQPELLAKTILSKPYLSGQSVIFTLPESPAVFDMEDLDGKVVSIRGAGGYPEAVATKYPKLRLLRLATADEVLAAVIQNRAHAAIGTEWTLQPFIERKYAGELNISRPKIGLDMQGQFASRSDEPLLASIIDKSLHSLRTMDESVIREKWLRNADYGAPNWRAIIKYNRLELITIAISLLLLTLLMQRANAAKRRALESERVKARFLATMSHEIRTPINAVVGAIELLQASPLDERQRRLATTAENAAEALGTLLDNVLDLSKIDEKGMKLERIPADLRQLLDKMADIFRIRAELNGIALRLVYPDQESPVVLVDPTRLRQVVLNLLDNAFKFTEQGSVVVTVGFTDRADKRATLHVSVQDTGIGMTEEQQTGLFKPYTQADSTTTRRYGGTGLGLALCKELIELMGGRIQLRSQPGVGTCVKFSLPVELAELTALDVGAQAGEQGGSAARILLVDDHADNRFIIGEQLKSIGAVADVAESGKEALQKLEGQDYALILMDCHMPDLDGYTTTRRLRDREQSHSLRRTPVMDWAN